MDLPQGVRMIPRHTLEVCAGMTLAQAIANADALGGDWAILLYADVYLEGDLTPNGGASITIKGMATERVSIAPTVVPTLAVIVSGHNLTLENLIVGAPSDARPALRVTGGLLTAKRSTISGVGVGDAIQQVGGNIQLEDDCDVPIGDIDLSGDDCVFEALSSHIHGPLDTAGALAHTLLLVQCDLHNQGINSLATGATTLDARGCSNMGLVRNDGTGAFVIRDSDVGSANQQDATGSITLYGGDLGSIAGHVGAVVWYKDSTMIRVPEGGDLQQALTGLPAAGGLISVGGDVFAFAAQVARAIDNVKIKGSGLATRFTLDGVTPVISAGVQDGWILADFDVDAGLVEIQFATNSTLHNITINGLHTTIINPDVGQTNFPGQPVIRAEEDRPLNPAIDVIRKDFTRREYQLFNPVFATPEFISDLLHRQARTYQVPINDLWADGSGGTGSSTLYPPFAEVACAANIGDHGLVYAPAPFMNSYLDGVQWDRVDFDNRLEFGFDISRDAGTHADIRARVQLKQAVGEGILANDGLGIEIQNFAIFGEAFAGAQGVVDLGIAMTALLTYRIKIVLVPNVGVLFYVNNVYRGVITAQIPTGPAAGACYWVISIDNGAVATACVFRCSAIAPVWQHL